MTRVLLATESDELEHRVRRAVGDELVSLPHGPLPTDPSHLFDQLGDAARPDVIVLDSGSSAASAALDLAARFDRQCPAISVVLVSDLGSEIGLDAMRAGVRDVLHPAAEIADIQTVLERAGQVAQVRRAESVPASSSALAEGGVRGSRVISVVSPKGGVGKTTVATNLAVGLARAAPNATVLVDLDIQFGDVATALGLQPEYTLPDAVHGPASRDAMVLKTFLTLHSTGLYAICGAESPAAADSITSDEVGRLLKVLASEFRYVVVDTAPGLSEHTLAAMDQSSDLVLVTSMDVPGVRGLRTEMATLTELGMPPDARHVVLNFVDRHGGLSTSDVEATLGTGIDVLIPRSRAAITSVNQGVPLLQSGVRDPMTRQLRRLVDRFVPAPAQPPGRHGGQHMSRKLVRR